MGPAGTCALNAPAWPVTVHEVLQAMAQIDPQAPQRVQFAPQPDIEAQFGAWPLDVSFALAQQLALGGGWTATPSAGVRLYRHSVYGRSSAPHAGLVLARGEGLAWRVNAARGLNHPGLDAALLNAIVPPLAGQAASIIKDSSLLSILGIEEFTLAAQQVNSATYSTLESYLPLAIGYLALTLPVSLLARYLEHKYRYET
jgi:hypothetical protein